MIRVVHAARSLFVSLALCALSGCVSIIEGGQVLFIAPSRLVSALDSDTVEITVTRYLSPLTRGWVYDIEFFVVDQALYNAVGTPNVGGRFYPNGEIHINSLAIAAGWQYEFLLHELAHAYYHLRLTPEDRDAFARDIDRFFAGARLSSALQAFLVMSLRSYAHVARLDIANELYAYTAQWLGRHALREEILDVLAVWQRPLPAYLLRHFVGFLSPRILSEYEDSPDWPSYSRNR